MVDPRLCASRRFELPFGVHRFEDGSVWDNDSDKFVGEIDVGVHPVLRGPGTVGQSNFGEEHIRQCITDCLIDKVDQGVK